MKKFRSKAEFEIWLSKHKLYPDNNEEIIEDKKVCKKNIED